MAEEQVIKLLEEIRDLQKLHIENYKDAVKNQQESIELQRRAIHRQKVIAITFASLLAVFIALVVWSSHAQ